MAILLGMIQGLTEFLPISSSGHLAVAMQLFSRLPNPEANLAFVVFTHLGTLLSVVLVFWRELWQALRNEWVVFGYLIAATIPAAAIGLTFKDFFSVLGSNLFVIGAGFFYTAALLLLVRKENGQEDRLPRVGYLRAVVVGCFQTIAILPGVSRSGSTLAGGKLVGLTHRNATVFAFLMSLPAVGGALLVEAKDIENVGQWLGGPTMIAAFLASFLSGMAGIWIVRRLMQTNKLHYFSYYLAAAGVATLLLHFR